ncbi:MAG: NADH-quinone oxidoreductase subunit J, partial [Thalassospira sp.]|nr:NADH-quinone oxidoreductase subunit J [Thalassospira sp.]
GKVIYTDYAYIFQAAGLVLLVAMIGAIVLTLRTREGVRRQKISEQVKRDRADTLEVKKVPVGRGI